jgi:tRNA pseudouridine synthase 10
MPDSAWRNIAFDEAALRPDLQARVRAGLAAGPLCDHCLGRLLAGVGTGMANEARGRILRRVLEAGPPPPECTLCHNLFDALGEWMVRAKEVLAGWEFATFAVSSRADPALAAREEAVHALSGPDLAEPYKQEFNRLLGIRLCKEAGLTADPAAPDITVMVHHATGRVTVDVKSLFLCGRYRKLVRGLPQCRWRAWETSIEQIVGEPISQAAAGRTYALHGCGREDTDVRCLGERPFVLEVRRPRRRRLDLADLAAGINADGRVEVLGLEPCAREAVARLKELHPDKSYRALARLADDVDAARCERLAGLVGVISQQTPVRVLKRRTDLVRRRRVLALQWRLLDARTLELTVRAQAGTYIKELVSSDGGRTTPSVAEVLGTAAECAELDVVAIHADQPPTR